MKLVSPLFNSIIDISDGAVASLVIENQDLFRALLTDIAFQIGGADGQAVLSRDNKPIALSKNAELLREFAPFEINSKTIQTRIVSELEALSSNETNWLRTSELIGQFERFTTDLSLDLPCDVECTKLTFGSMLKSAGVSAVCRSDEPIGAVLEYMELIRALCGRRLFIAVNMRSFFSDQKMELFAKDVAAKKLDLLLLEGCDRPRLENERRWTIDRDLCEF